MTVYTEVDPLDDDPLADDVDPLDRDRWGRPLIVPAKRDGTPNLKGKPAPYTRASTFNGYPSDKSGLVTWQLRHAVVGVAMSPDLAGMAAALGPNPDDFTPAQKRELDAIIETAHDRSGGNGKANYGTAVHTLTEPGNAGYVPDRMAADVEAYAAVLAAAGIVVLDTERFTVNDDMTVAGTYDHRVEFTRELTLTTKAGVEVTIAAGTRMILDKKTGTLHFDEHAIQLATYARGKLFDPVTGERTALDVSPQWGLVAHIPKEGGKASLYLVDLHAGWKGAKVAADVRAWRSGGSKLGTKFAEVVANAPAEIEPDVEGDAVVDATPDRTPADVPAPAEVDEVDDTAAALAVVEAAFGPTTEVVDPIVAAIKLADEAGCKALWTRHRRVWADTHTEAVKARLVELGGHQ